MEIIGKGQLRSFANGSRAIETVTNGQVRKGSPVNVNTFPDLATLIATLQFENRDHFLLFRGQGSDHLNQKQMSTLKPNLFRLEPATTTPPSRSALEQRFRTLINAEFQLTSCWDARFGSAERLKRYRILRWAIIQHYQICPTPLLDVTQSLRVAASMASASGKDEGFLFVLGVPNVGGAVTASAEAGLQIVRLAGVCPPQAVRPHIQEGYLLGEYPDMGDFEQKHHYSHHEIDFGRRLIAKFTFNPRSFWDSRNFPRVSKSALYPSDADDPFLKLVSTVKSAAGIA